MSANFDRPELPSIGIIAPLADEDRRYLSSYGEFLPVHPNQILIEEGARQNSLYVVISGLLHASIVRSGRTVLLGRIESGVVIGEVNIFDAAEASATVLAIEFSQVWRIDRDMLESFINEHPLPAAHLLVGIAKTLATRLREVNQKISNLAAGLP